jgi:prevent-host-death family protein
MDGGVREFKQHLSEYLDRFEKGETIRITERGRPKVLLSPIPGAGSLQRGIDEGWIRPPVHDDGLRAVEAVPADGRVLDLLEEDRGA